MKLSVPTPPGWSRQSVVEGELLRSPETDRELLILPFEGVRTMPPQWIYKALVRDLPPGTEPTALVQGELETESGWIAITLEAKIGERSRIVAYFSFLDYSVTTIATASALSVPTWRAQVTEILYFATPNFAGDRVTGVGEMLGTAPPIEITAPRPSSATWRRTSSGGDVVLTSTVAPDSGWIRCSFGHVPIRPASVLLGHTDDAPEAGITAEGEYYVLGFQREPTTITAVVFGAESYTRIVAIVLDPAAFDIYLDATRNLAFSTTFGYGRERIRPFYYQPPDGWIGLARPRSTAWISPTCARRYHVLRVFEARPPERDEVARARRFETLEAALLAKPARGPATFWTRRSGLECRVLAYSGSIFGGRELNILDGSVVDEQYLYPLRIECDPRLLDASIQLFEDVAESVIPLPTAVVVSPPNTLGSFSNWSD